MRYASNNEAEQLGISQVMLLASFMQIKTEILSLLVETRQENVYQPLINSIFELDMCLDDLNISYVPIKGESGAAATLRRRGQNVLLLKVHEALIEVRNAMETFHGWAANESFAPWETDVLNKTIDSLYHIYDAAELILRNPRIFSRM